MDGQYFEQFVRTLSCGSSRRNVLAGMAGGLLASLHVALGDNVAAKKKHKKKKKKSPPPCPRAQNCAGKQCGDDGCGGSCGTCEDYEECNAEGQCVCTPDCTGKECGDNGCGGDCGDCEGNDQCDAEGQCVPCTPNCTGKVCGGDGCGGSCGTCENGACQGGQCLCPFATGCDPVDEGECATCSPGVCCPNEQACLSGACATCPETPDPCNVEHVCGWTTARGPFCYCVTSVDDITTCTSVFGNPAAQIATVGGDCETDADCEGNLGPGVEMVCVHAPCLENDAMGLHKICMNKGCVDLTPGRARSHSEADAASIVQLDLRPGS